MGGCRDGRAREASATTAAAEAPGRSVEDPAAALAGATMLPRRAAPAREPAAATQEVDDGRTSAIVRAARRVSPAVVSISTLRREYRAPSFFNDFFGVPRTRQAVGFGSGFIFRPDGYIITNDHVIDGAERIQVTLPDGRDFEARLIGTDPLADVAVLRIDGRDLPVAPLGTSHDLLIGEWALAIGNPLATLLSDPEPTVTAGVISALNRNLTPSGREAGFYLGMIQTDASINPGNSGGPLVDAEGRVIGVNSSIFSRSGGSEGLGFAIPIDRALLVAGDLIDHGEVRRAWLGMDVEPSEQDIWGRTRGVVVARVTPNSPATSAGLRPGDRLLEANGRRLMTPLDYQAVLLDLRPGDEVALTVEGRSRTLTLEASTLPSESAARVTALEQLELVTVTPAIRDERGLRFDAGALVVSIGPELARQLPLREGDVILQINRARITSAEQAARLLRTVSGQVDLWFERGGAVSRVVFYWRRAGV
ncbi:MAG: PDZ domain-containing protein [Gemmatimonadetes bacterium]|nr:MAG: PDZ domain-containing protein [Gemmatimonadota bacterium]